MTNQPPSDPPVTFIDNSHAPDVFVDGVSGLFFFQGNIRLTLESARVNHSSSPGPVNRVVIGRLVLPLSAAEGLRDLLNDYLAKLKGQNGDVQAPGTTSVH